MARCKRLLAFCLTLFVLLSVATTAFSQVRVRGYYRKDGTYVRPHYRSKPDGNFNNNWSTKGNTNPYTGKKGTKTSPSRGYGSDVKVDGYIRGDGTYVQPHYRSAPDGRVDNNWSSSGNINPYTGKPGKKTTDLGSYSIRSGTSGNTPARSQKATADPEVVRSNQHLATLTSLSALLKDESLSEFATYRAARWGTEGDSTAEARYLLAILYFSGSTSPPIKKDRRRAAGWFSLAAKGGDMHAQRSLAICFQFGYGVNIDLAAARAWYIKAAKQGNLLAAKQLATSEFASNKSISRIDISPTLARAFAMSFALGSDGYVDNKASVFWFSQISN